MVTMPAFSKCRRAGTQGIIQPDDYETARDELAARLKAIRGPKGEEWQTVVIKPQEHYPVVNGDYPDLMVYFDDLYWRSAGTLAMAVFILRKMIPGRMTLFMITMESIFYDPDSPGGEGKAGQYY